jgi:hypothetical protein
MSPTNRLDGHPQCKQDINWIAPPQIMFHLHSVPRHIHPTAAACGCVVLQV